VNVKVLVVGDRIVDQTSICKATRLCPEAPAPVLHTKEEKTTAGGAHNVAKNIESLLGADQVDSEFGSVSYKHRIFADRTLICRIDRDRHSVMAPTAYWNNVLRKAAGADAIVVGDYAKGAITSGIASGLIALKKPLFVDAKDGVDMYTGCFAIFPNENEHAEVDRTKFQHVIRKLGERGCSVDGVLVPTVPQHVYDVSGAGDVFIAAFVTKYLQLWGSDRSSPPDTSAQLIECARYANLAAGISVRYLGTHVVTAQEIQEHSK
jgi:bifunctional ADP-heptose synthase (sugar kinase/adenylyltransferase)